MPHFENFTEGIAGAYCVSLALVVVRCGRVQLDVVPGVVPMRSQLDVVLPTSRRSPRAPNITLTKIRLLKTKKP